MGSLNCTFMDRAFELAERGLNTTMPNPRVGCVIVNGGKIVGEGYHRRSGEDHAEVVAIKSAGEKARNGSMYVTLEPCCFKGKTGACTDQIIRSGISEVIVASRDPNPRVAGKGLLRLEEKGISVSTRKDLEKAIELNPGFFKRMTKGLPWVRVKIAKSLDGYIAMDSGESKWITGPKAREDGHRWRARSCCILTGSQTVRQDNPRLTARDGERILSNPIKVIVDPNLICEITSNVFAEGNTMLATVKTEESNKTKKIEAMRDRNINVIEFPTAESKSNRFSLKSLLAELAKQECNEVQVEAGPGLITSLFNEKVIDEFLVYQSPKILGSGLSLIDKIGEKNVLKKKGDWCYKSTCMIGEDIRMILRRSECGDCSFE